jgi:hypothetical protein
MKHIYVIILICVTYAGALYADDYKWDLVNALIRNDSRVIENILKENVNTMSAAEKRLVMNFALTYSYGENAAKVITLLLNYNIRPISFDLYTAINRNQPDNVINLILQNGAEANGEILLLTMEKQRFNLARQFIEAGADVNYQYPLSRSYADGMTALLYASRWNNLEMAQLLLEHGANINARTRDGNTALSIARANGSTPIHNLLIEHGADQSVNIITPSQNTGISSLLNSQTVVFQTGTYRLFGGNVDIRFYGNANSGSISYIRDGRTNAGTYIIEGGNIAIMLEGRTFTYKIDSNTSFSGNAEVWIRTGN